MLKANLSSRELISPVSKLGLHTQDGDEQVKYTFGITFQSLNIGKNVGMSGLLAFSLCHRLIGYAVSMIDLMTIGSQDIRRSPPLVMADNGDTMLEDGYQFVCWSLA